MRTESHGVPADSRYWWETEQESTLPQYLITTVAVVAITPPALILAPVVGHGAIALIYMLLVVVLSLFTGRGAAFFAAALSAVLWDFFFITPTLGFHIDHMEDAVMLVLYFLVALVLGQLTTQISAEVKVRRQGEEEAKMLYRLMRQLADAADMNEVLENAVEQTGQVFDATVAVLLPDAPGRLSYQAQAASTYEIAGPEQPVADWVFEQSQPAGKFSRNLSHTDALFLPLQSGNHKMGVMGVHFDQAAPPTVRQRRLLNAFAQQIALALKRQQLWEESGKAKRLAESERLSKALLNSMSLEIQAPVMVIKSAAKNLAELADPGTSELSRNKLAEIEDAAKQLDRWVQKALDIAQLESGCIQPKPELCDVRELVHAAIDETRRNLTWHKVVVEIAPGLPQVRMDFVLLQQALANLLLNAAQHTPAGTAVLMRARASNGSLLLTVSDRGPGLPTAALPRLFEKFYRGSTATADGMGMGLWLARGFVEAHGGRVSAENRLGGGATFTISLPLA